MRSSASPQLPSPAPIAPPVAEARPVERLLWGDLSTDDFAWLCDRDDDDVLEHLDAENAYTISVLGPVQDLQDALFNEIKGRIV